ncbi:AAA ATPase domain-containing protein [Burkholderia sp. OK233]|nr:AAA ATPase domain-containing protein [Burkholderia sp. OK233]
MTPTQAPLDKAQLFAALSGPFEPKDALQRLLLANKPDMLVMAATRLAEVCDTNPVGDSERWLMRTPTRRALLLTLLERAQLAEAVAERRGLNPDPETVDLLAVLLDESPLARTDIRAALNEGTDGAKLARIIVALDRAGEVAPAKDLLRAVRAALAEVNRAANRQRIAERGFFGRKNESAIIAQWLSHQPLAARMTCLFVTGTPGIGKSALLAETVRRYYTQTRPLILRLDFDQAGLDVQDQFGLTMEVARQLEEQLGAQGDELLEARLDAGRVTETSVRQQLSLRQGLPERLVATLGKAVAAAGRPVLVLLDTLEVLRGRGETHPATLFDWLARLMDRGVQPMHVLAAGRGDALDSLSQSDSWAGSRVRASRQKEEVKRIELHGLEESASRELLTKLGVAPSDQARLLEIAQGNPLKLRLAAEIALRSHVEHLPISNQEGKVSAAFLYRFLLSRIEDRDLRKLAHPGLIVRRINARLIREVLVPTLGLAPITTKRADELLRELGTHHWLVEPDPGTPGFLKHRSDMRRLLLPMLYSSEPNQAAEIDMAAAHWFADLREPWADVEAAYHRLQLSRRGHSMQSVPVSIASQFDAEMLAELPAAASDMVLSTRGERTGQFRGASTGGIRGNDAGVVREILSIVQRQDWKEGSYIVRKITDSGGVDARSEVADATRMFLWRSGQWHQARVSLRDRDRGRMDDFDDDLEGLPEAIALSRLEMRAEFHPEKLRRQWRRLRPLLNQLDSVNNSAPDDVARRGALALLLANLPEPFRFSNSSSRERECDLASAANERWVGGYGNEMNVADSLGHERLARVMPQHLPQQSIPPGQVLATLTPYSVFANNLSVRQEHARLRDTAMSFAGVIAAAGALLGSDVPPLPTPDTSDPIGWISDAGLFAEWAQAVAFDHSNADLRLIGRSADRWRRTMAGDWSIGIRRDEWRSRPVLDDTLEARVADLMRSGPSLFRARNQLGVWEQALVTRQLEPRLVRRWLTGSLVYRNLRPYTLHTPEAFARTLLARGCPSAFAPALSVLMFAS